MKISPEQDQAIIRMRTQVAVRNGISIEEMIGPSHEQRLVRARREFSIEARRFGFSLPAIGRYLGGRHHTTVLHLLRTQSKVRKPEASLLRLA